VLTTFADCNTYGSIFTNGFYIDREKAQEVAELYHEAKRQRKQPKKLLESKYPEIFELPKK
jgi:hypothetical protein